MLKQVMHETKTHGKLSFPYTVYRGNIPEYLKGYPLHWHDEMEMIYITSGCGIITIQTHQYTVKKGDMIIIPPQVVHSIEQFKSEQMEYFNILFHFSLLTASQSDPCYEKYFKPLYEHTRSIPYYLPFNTTLNLILEPFIRSLIEQRKKSYTEDELMVKSNLFAIVHHLNQYSFETSSSDLTLQSTYDKLKILLLHIQEHYAETISIETASALCGFSSSHFMKLFKELTGKSFSQYLKHYRLEIAAKQLESSSNNITHIAEDAGFNNLSYFTRAFINEYGETPSAYRTKKQSNAPNHSKRN